MSRSVSGIASGRPWHDAISPQTATDSPEPTQLDTPSAVASPPPQQRSACRQCRARKVKCDRSGPCCGACTRLKLACSFSPGAQDQDDIVPRDSTLTEAGMKRRRTRQACRQCRVLKIKCSGENPCSRCRSRSQRCIHVDSSSSSRQLDLPVVQQAWSCSTPDSNSQSNTISPSADISTMQADKVTTRKYIEAYFDRSNPMSCIFLHRPSILADWSQEKIDPVLLKALCALGLMLLCNGMDSNVNDSLSLARNWLADVQQCLLAKVGRMTIVQLQALILIVRYRLESGDTAEAWALLPLAARLAFTLRLNYELTSMQPIGQESRRRMVWAIWLIDRQFSDGIQDLAVFPTERVHIRLPCDDHSFERGIPSRAQYLNGLGLQTEGYNMDILSYYLQLHVSRDRILK
ncbi:hypothetical protein AUP68_03663 [Ilyonectria robusta]